MRGSMKSLFARQPTTKDALGFSSKTPQNIKDAWGVFDIDSDGTISRDEFLAVLTRESTGKHALTADQAEILFDEADVDGSGRIDVDEFASAWAEMNAQYGLQHMFPKAGPRRMSRGATFLQRATSIASKMSLTKTKQ